MVIVVVTVVSVVFIFELTEEFISELREVFISKLTVVSVVSKNIEVVVFVVSADSVGLTAVDGVYGGRFSFCPQEQSKISAVNDKTNITSFISSFLSLKLQQGKPFRLSPFFYMIISLYEPNSWELPL